MERERERQLCARNSLPPDPIQKKKKNYQKIIFYIQYVRSPCKMLGLSIKAYKTGNLFILIVK